MVVQRLKDLHGEDVDLTLLKIEWVRSDLANDLNHGLNVEFFSRDLRDPFPCSLNRGAVLFLRRFFF